MLHESPPLCDCMSLVHVGRTSIPYLQPSGFGHLFHFGSHFCKCEALCDRHIDVDWSPIIEDLYKPELGFMDICVTGFTIGNPLGCRGSACVEVMTTLHGSAPSLRRRAEGCVPTEGSMLCSQSEFTILGQSKWKISPIFREIKHGSAVQDETPHDTLPPPLPPPVLTVPQASPYLLHGPSEGASPIVVQITVIDDAHTLMDRIERCMRQLRASDGSAVWDDLEGMPVASLPAKFRMLDIKRYTGIGCPRIHLRLYSTVMKAHNWTNVSRKELEALRQGSDESISSFISYLGGKITEIIDRSLQPKISRHVVGVPFTDFGSLVLALYDVEDGISRETSCFIFCHRAAMLCDTVSDLCSFCFENAETVFKVGYAIEPGSLETHRG
ncbi:hypothetical protein AAG906_022127 [Vitis piasezkii]